MHDTAISILRDMLTLPTASFREEAVVAWVRAFAMAHGLALQADPAGNLLLTVRRGRPRRTWVYVAHMDHPAFVATRAAGRTVWATFRGGVRREYFAGSPVRFLTPGGERVGRVTSLRRAAQAVWPVARIVLAESGPPVPVGSIGMWDVTPFQIRGKRVSARACDDLGGVAAGLLALAGLTEGRAAVDVRLLLTRAEEVGFIGTLAACRGGLLPRSAWWVGIETSAAHPSAPLGGGVVVRVGDRTSIFDPGVSAMLAATATDLAAAHPEFTWHRQLMAGGTCETTPLCLHGYRAGAVCVPLGNYHNMGPGKRVAPEQIDLDDWCNLVRLLAALPFSPHTPETIAERVGDRLAKTFGRLAPLLKGTS